MLLCDLLLAQRASLVIEVSVAEMSLYGDTVSYSVGLRVMIMQQWTLNFFGMTYGRVFTEMFLSGCCASFQTQSQTLWKSLHLFNRSVLFYVWRNYLN